MSEPGRWAALARSRSQDVGTCWMWQGAKDRYGYARVRDGKRIDRLHHLLCIEVHQPPKGRRWVARHLCDCKACVNPAHIEPGTQAQNRKDDRVQALRRVELPSIEAVAKLAGLVPAFNMPPLNMTEVRQAERRQRLAIDQSTRGGEGIAEVWFKDMAAHVSSLTKNPAQGWTRDAADEDVLLLSLIARKKRELAGKPEPEGTGLSTGGADNSRIFRRDGTAG